MTSKDFDFFSIVRKLEEPVGEDAVDARDADVEFLAGAMRADPAKVQDLVRFLATGVWSAREAVARALAKVPELSRPVLLDSLDQNNPELTAWCLKVLSKAGKPGDMAKIEAILTWPDSRVQTAAISCLSSIGKSAAAPRLAKFLSGHAWRTARAAFDGLMASWTESDGKLDNPVSMAEEFLTSRDHELHYWAIRILSDLPPCDQTLKPLRKYAADPASPMGFFAASSIARAGILSDLDLIITTLQRDDGWFTARTLLPRLENFNDPRILNIVLAAFSEDDEAVAPKALEVVATMMDSAGPVLSSMLREGNPSMVRWCCLALGQGKYRPALPAMLEIVRATRNGEGSRKILPWVIEGIGLMESLDPGVVETLAWAASSEDWYLRTKSVESMIKVYKSAEKHAASQEAGTAVSSEEVARTIYPALTAMEKTLSEAASDRCWTVRNAALRFEPRTKKINGNQG